MHGTSDDMIRGPQGNFFNIPEVYVGGLYHVVYRSNEDREIVAAIRTPIDGIDWDTISRLVKQAQQDGVIKKCDTVPDFAVDYWSGWEMILAFELAPCIEMYIKKVGLTGTTHDYRVISSKSQC